MNERKISYQKTQLWIFGILLALFACWGISWIIEPVVQNRILLHNLHHGSWLLLEFVWIAFVVVRVFTILSLSVLEKYRFHFMLSKSHDSLASSERDK